MGADTTRRLRRRIRGTCTELLRKAGDQEFDGAEGADVRLVSCPRNSSPNFWDKQATRINNLCPAATRNLIRRISESGH
jgi:hypothetical protein